MHLLSAAAFIFIPALSRRSLLALMQIVLITLFDQSLVNLTRVVVIRAERHGLKLRLKFKHLYRNRKRHGSGRWLREAVLAGSNSRKCDGTRSVQTSQLKAARISTSQKRYFPIAASDPGRPNRVNVDASRQAV